MRVGVVGLGKLGLPVALCLEAAGHDVWGCEDSVIRRTDIRALNVPEAAFESGVADLLAESDLPGKITDPGGLAYSFRPDVILVCVQTPHDPRFEGTLPVEDEPEDFDYNHLRAAISDLAATNTEALVVIVSTCLPGTFEREIRPIAGNLRIAYHPLFIAMGSVIEDYRHPEFVLIGSDGDECPPEIWELYAPLYGAAYSPARMRKGMVPFDHPPVRHMSITSAELTKVAYNAAIGYKLMLANGIAELCDRVSADADDVMGTLRLADKRIASGAYLTPGMGDGGGCHPRDQIALSWLAGESGMTHDPFGFIVVARELHAEWLSGVWWHEACRVCLPPIMLGGAYKPNTTLRTGSHALLVAHYMGKHHPVRVEDEPLDAYPRATYFLATPHDHFLSALLPRGSVLVDPWGVFPEREGVRVVRPGRRAHHHQLSGSGDVSSSTRRVA